MLFKKTEESASSLGEISSLLEKIQETESSHGKNLQKISKVQIDKKGTKSFKKSKVVDNEEGTVKAMYLEFHEKLFESGNKHIDFATSILKLQEEIDNWLKEAEKTRKKVNNIFLDLNFWFKKNFLPKLISDAKEAKKEYDTALEKLKEVNKKNKKKKLKEKANMRLSKAENPFWKLSPFLNFQ